MTSDANLKVTFSAEWDGLVEATKASSSAVKGFAADVNSSMQNVAAASTKALAPLANIKVDTGSLSAATSVMKDVEIAAGGAAHGTAGFYREILVLGHEMISGRFSRIPGSMMVLAERSGNLSTMFEAVLAVATPMNLAIAASGVALVAVAVGAERAAESLAKVHVAMSSVGNGYLFDPAQVEAMSTSLEHLAGVGAKEAEAMMVELGHSVNMTSGELKEIQENLPDLVAKFGGTEAAGKALKEAVDDTAAATRRYREELANTNPEALANIEHLLAIGRNADAAKALIDALTQSAKGLHDEGLTPMGEAWETAKSHMQAFITAIDPAVGILVSAAQGAEMLAAGVLHIGEAIARMQPGVVGLQQALKQVAVEAAGQTYNMDKSIAYNEAIIKQNQTIAAGISSVAKADTAKTATILRDIQTLEAARDAAMAKSRTSAGNGDTQGAAADSALAAQFSAQILAKQKELQAQQTQQAKTAQTQQLQDWEAHLTDELEQQNLFGDKAKAFEIAYWEEKKQLATKGTDEYRQISQKLYELQSQEYDKDLAAAKRAETEKTAAAKKAEEDRIKDILKHFDELAALYKDDYAKYVQIEQQKSTYIKAIYGRESAEAEQQNAKLNQIEQQHLDKTKQQWTSVFDSVKSTFNSAITGMIQGTETFGQAAQNVFLGLGEAVIGVLEEIAEKWLITQIFGETSTQTQAHAGIAASAAQAGAAAFASTAAIPIIGPELAPAAGAAAYAGALGYEALASFDVGSWSVPGDMTANIHQGEMILPKPFADSVRENGGFGTGGSGDTHLHLHGTVIDGRSVKDFFYNNSGHITGAIKKAHRNGGSLPGMA